MKTRMFFSFLLAASLVLGVCEAHAQLFHGFVKKVNCTNGETIARALQVLDIVPITIQVKGTCNENISIVLDDVTLKSDPLGGTINGTDPDNPTITVNAARTVIDGLTVTGGRSGIKVVGSATIQNCIVQYTGQSGGSSSGISFYHGGQGKVDNCTVQNNEGYGVVIEGGSATVTNSRISSNGAAGILLTLSGSARIGITDRFEYAGNTISTNASAGIRINGSSSSSIGGNIIQGNGTNISSSDQCGVGVYNATATLVGNNKITGNTGPGVFASASAIVIGQPGTPLPITGPFANEITGNGAIAAPKGGVFGFLGSSLEIRFAKINGNFGNGVGLNLRSTARMFDNIVNNNTGNGISLALGGGLLLLGTATVPPVAPVTVTGNGLYGLQCSDTESSFAGDISGILGNSVGNVSPTCTGF
jgi:parallel beta-helix repeat protein